MLHNRSLGGTIAGGFASLLAIMAVVIVFVVREVDVIQSQRRLLTDELLPAVHACDQIALQAVSFEDKLQSFVATRLPADLTDVRLSDRSMLHAEADLKRLRFSDRQEDYLSAQVIAAVGNLDRQAPLAEQLGIAAPPERAGEFVHRYVKSSVADVAAAEVRLARHVDARAELTRAAIDLRQLRLVQSLILAFIWAGVIGILVALLCVRLVTDPVTRLVMAAQAMESGDFSLAHHLGETVGKESPRNELTTLAQTFAHMAAVLEEREHQLRSQTVHLAAANAQLTALQSLTDVALSEVPLNQLLEQLLQRVVIGIGAASGAIYLADSESGRLTAATVVNPEGVESKALPSETDEAELLGSGGEIIASPCERASESPPSPAAPTPVGVKEWLVVRIGVGNQRVGLARVNFMPPRTIDSYSVNLIRVFGERVAWAIERARTLDELESWGHELERRYDQQRTQLLRSERLAAIGLVGSSIAHELRNPLGVINNAVYFLQHRSNDIDDKMRRHLDIIRREVQQSRRIIDGLVDYSEVNEPESRRLNINTLIRTALEECALPETVTVEPALNEDLPTVIGDESQLLLVFEHLIRNASQAMSGHGVLRIANRATDFAVETSFQDTGPGVAAEDQSRIFEPFVSTRVKGMGLGLSIARKILEAHCGEIRLISVPGCGATFTVELPITDRVHFPRVQPEAGHANG